ncbi:MAG: hypothetical protein IKI40_09235 [Treponema sp.]|nr:hypothetical protein [Treponema sp.]
MKREHINPEYRDIKVIQMFYQEGYMQGVTDKNPNYEYAMKYKEIVERLLRLFEKTVNPLGLEQLEMSLNEMDKFRKEHLMM